MSEYVVVRYGSELEHHGIKGQKWGIRRYQNEDGTLTTAGRMRYVRDASAKLDKADVLKEQSKKNAKKSILSSVGAATTGVSLAVGLGDASIIGGLIAGISGVGTAALAMTAAVSAGKAIIDNIKAGKETDIANQMMSELDEYDITHESIKKDKDAR